nr:6370_t:CDS:2 [Entrophospora candida]
MKDMLDSLIIKFHEAAINDSGLYVLGIQGLVNNLVDRLNNLINIDIGTLPPRCPLNIMKTPHLPPRKRKIKAPKDYENN